MSLYRFSIVIVLLYKDETMKKIIDPTNYHLFIFGNRLLRSTKWGILIVRSEIK